MLWESLMEAFGLISKCNFRRGPCNVLLSTENTNLSPLRLRLWNSTSNNYLRWQLCLIYSEIDTLQCIDHKNLLQKFWNFLETSALSTFAFFGKIVHIGIWMSNHCYRDCLWSRKKQIYSSYVNQQIYNFPTITTSISLRLPLQKFSITL